METTSAKPATSDTPEDPVLPFAVDGLESEDEPKRKDKSAGSSTKRTSGVADVGKQTKRQKVSDNK